MDEFEKIVADIKSKRQPLSTEWHPPTLELVNFFGAFENSLNNLGDTARCLRAILSLGEVLREACWDFRLPDLLDRDSDHRYDYEFAVRLLEEGSNLSPDTKKLTNAFDCIRTTPELTNVRERIREIRDKLETIELDELRMAAETDLKHSHQIALPWTPHMKRADFVSAIKPLNGERVMRKALEKGSWVSDPPWSEKKGKKRRYRSKDPDEQRQILQNVREFLSQRDS